VTNFIALCYEISQTLLANALTTEQSAGLDDLLVVRRCLSEIDLWLAAYGHRDGNSILVTAAISGVLSSEF
jgi:hypothetical protein